MKEWMRRRYLEGLWEFISAAPPSSTPRRSASTSRSRSAPPPILNGHTEGLDPPTTSTTAPVRRSSGRTDPLRIKPSHGPLTVWKRPVRDTDRQRDDRRPQGAPLRALHRRQLRARTRLLGDPGDRRERVRAGRRVAGQAGDRTRRRGGVPARPSLQRRHDRDGADRRLGARRRAGAEVATATRASTRGASSTGSARSGRTAPASTPPADAEPRASKPSKPRCASASSGSTRLRAINEMGTFVYSDKEKAEAQPGCNDDLVMALAIGVKVAADMPRKIVTRARSSGSRRPWQRPDGDLTGKDVRFASVSQMLPQGPPLVSHQGQARSHRACSPLSVRRRGHPPPGGPQVSARPRRPPTTSGQGPPRPAADAPDRASSRCPA